MPQRVNLTSKSDTITISFRVEALNFSIIFRIFGCLIDYKLINE